MNRFLRVLMIAIFLIIQSNKSYSFGCYNYDKLIISKDTVSLIYSPIYSHPNKTDILKRIAENSSEKNNCFISVWEILNNKFFLVSILEIKNYPNNKTEYLPINLYNVFGDEFNSGKVFASWVSDSLISPSGKSLFTLDHINRNIYAQETDYFINNGNFTHSINYDNSSSYRPTYGMRQQEIIDLIENNFDFNLLPDYSRDTTITVFIQFSGNEYGRVDSVITLRGKINQAVEDEFVRILSSIHDYGIVLIRGKLFRLYYNLPIRFRITKDSKYYIRPR